MQVLDASVPNRCIQVLVERTTLHWVIEHVLKLTVRDRVDLIAFALVISSAVLLLVLLCQNSVHVINWAAVDITFIVDHHVWRQSCQDKCYGEDHNE